MVLEFPVSVSAKLAFKPVSDLPRLRVRILVERAQELGALVRIKYAFSHRRDIDSRTRVVWVATVTGADDPSAFEGFVEEIECDTTLAGRPGETVDTARRPCVNRPLIGGRQVYGPLCRVLIRPICASITDLRTCAGG